MNKLDAALNGCVRFALPAPFQNQLIVKNLIETIEQIW